MLEYPPILSGSAEKQIQLLRSYLVRLIQKLNENDKQE